MRVGPRLAVVAAACCLIPGTSAGNPPSSLRQFTDSRSGQFAVFHADPAVRGAMARFSESVKGDLLQRLALRDNWQHPIVIRLLDVPDGGTLPHYGNLMVLGGDVGLRVQLDLPWKHDRLAVDYRREVLRALCAELSYRGATDVDENHIAHVPAWLVEGLVGVIDISSDELPSSLFQSLLEGSDPLDPALLDKVRFEVLPPTVAAVQRAKAAALVRSLLDFPKGAERLRAFIVSLRDPALADLSLRVRLERHFEELAGDPTALQKWWSIALAQLASATRVGPGTLAVTASRLEEILNPPPVDGEKLLPFTEIITDCSDPDHAAALQQMGLELTRLSTTASPLFIPLVTEYHSVMAMALSGKAKPGQLAARVEEVEGIRRGLMAMAGEVEDYLNWIQATQIGTRSGEFDAYFEAAAAMAAEPPPSRDDAITSYLDTLEAALDTARGIE